MASVEVKKVETKYALHLTEIEARVVLTLIDSCSPEVDKMAFRLGNREVYQVTTALLGAGVTKIK